MARTRFKVEHAENANRSLANEFKEGLAYIRKNSMVMSVILTAALIGFFGIPLVQQLPALARDVYKTVLDTETIIATRTSNLYAAQGVGAVTAAILMAYWSGSSNKQRLLLIGQIAFIFPTIALGLAHNVNLATVLLIVIGWGTVTLLVTMNTLIQVAVPDDLRGRVFSIYFWALQGVAPFGSFFIGWLAQIWNVPITIVIGGIICLVGVILIQAWFRSVRQTLA